MHYELYIDVLFLVNFTMDYLLLLITRRALSCSATHGSVCMGAMVGSMATCIVVALPITYAFIKFILFHVVVNTLMIKIGLKIKDIRELFKAYIMLYCSGFLLGGVFEHLQQYVRVGSLFVVLAISSYYVVRGIWNFFICIHRVNRYQCKVQLYFNEHSFQVTAIIDTGNSLEDPLTNRPVCIIDKHTARQLISEAELDSMRCIHYHTIGKTQGELPVFQLNKMCVVKEQEYWVYEPVIGVCEESISTTEEYQMILNPNIF
ncbi:MAG: sigma-E processing peptidase SpoIIGA [Lachnospiraceae bacterium]